MAQDDTQVNNEKIKRVMPKGRGYGFATLKYHDPHRLQEICSMGGKAAQATGKAHKFTPEEASRAGRLGGRGKVKIK